MPGEHLVEHDAGRVDVAAGVGAAAFELLGGEVGDRADEHAAGLAGLPRADDGARQAEVGDLHHAVDADEHVLGLDVAVHDARPVRGGEAGQHRLEDGEGLRDREPAARGEQVAQRAAAHELHDEEDQTLVAALVADRHHVDVAEHRRRTCLAGEPVDERGVVGQVLGHDLDRDGPVDPEVGGGVHGGHAAARQPLLEPVAPLQDLPVGGFGAVAGHGHGHGSQYGGSAVPPAAGGSTRVAVRGERRRPRVRRGTR
jgi:hypothetical protein